MSDENNNYEVTKEQDSEFLEKEHKAGFHDKNVEGCQTCWAENLVVRTPPSTYPEGINRFNPPWLD